MKKPTIILIGGGGHCKSCIDVIEQENNFTIAGIVDVKEKVGQQILGYPIIGEDNDLKELVNQYDYFLITLGQIKSAKLRISLFNKIKGYGAKLPIIISPLAYVSKHAIIGEGSIIMHGAIINASSSIGSNCIINTKSLIEHDVSVDDHCHISTGSIINGNCKIEIGVFIGSNSIVNQGISIVRNGIIGSGTVVNQDINNTDSMWVGNPAKKK